jgi:hypothetical protein
VRARGLDWLKIGSLAPGPLFSDENDVEERDALSAVVEHDF